MLPGPKTCHRWSIAAAASAITLVLGSQAFADKFWTNATGNGLWNDAGNWLNVGAPSGGDGTPTVNDFAFLTAGTITVPAGVAATAYSIDRQSSSPIGPITIGGAGHLSTNAVTNNAGSVSLTVSVNMGASAEALVLRGITVPGTIGGGAA